MRKVEPCSPSAESWILCPHYNVSGASTPLQRDAVHAVAFNTLAAAAAAAAAAASGSDPLANQLPRRLQAGLGFSLAPLPRTASRSVNHRSTAPLFLPLTHWHSRHGNAGPGRPRCQEQEFSGI